MGLIEYYKKFIKAYSLIVAPLTALLKNNSFTWIEEPTKAFEKLKKPITHSPILRLPNLIKPFTIECDASGVGVGTVLMQTCQPIAFLS